MSDSDDYVAGQSDSDYVEDGSGGDSDWDAEEDRDQNPKAKKSASKAKATPASTRGKRKSDAAEPGGRNTAKKPRGTPGAPKLKDAVRSATKEQLETLLLQLGSDPDVHSHIMALLPQPDVDKVIAEVTKMRRKMWSSFPRAKWGNNRDKYAYNRVKGALAAYKLELLKHAREYASCKQHTALHAYLLYAAGEVSDMPVFDSDSMNGHFRQGAETLLRLLAKSAAQLQLSEADCQQRHSCVEDWQSKYIGKDRDCLQAALAALLAICPQAAQRRTAGGGGGYHGLARGLAADEEEEEELRAA